jgi:tetratricopeptide (TPR) repeat protein
MPGSTPGDGTDEAQRLARLANGAFEKGDLAAARGYYERVLTLAPGSPAARINLGLIAYRQRRFEDAENILREVIRGYPESGLAWLILGIVYYDQDKLEAALAALAQAVWLEPKDARAHHYLGVAIGRRGWYSGAEDEMRKALELQPDYAEAHYNLAVFYLQRNPPALELARRHYQKSLDLGAAPDADTEKLLGTP